MDQHEAIEQLTWYFQCAESACGNRTPIGTHLDMQRTGVSFGSSRPDAELGAACRLDKMRKEAGDDGDTWLRTVQHRLRQVPSAVRGVLEAAFGDVRTLALDDGVSVTLACATEAAVLAHRASVEVEAARRLAAGKVPHIGLGAESRSEFLNRICEPNRSGEQGEALERIIAEARALRTEALKAYCETKLSEDEYVKRAELWADMDRDQRIRLEALEEFAEVAAPWHDQMLYGHGIHVDECKRTEPERVVMWKCKGCGAGFPVVIHAEEGGRPKEYCSDKCAQEAERVSNRERQKAWRERQKAAQLAA